MKKLTDCPKCGFHYAKFIRLYNHEHAGKFVCDRCGHYIKWASKEVAEFLSRITEIILSEDIKVRYEGNVRVSNPVFKEQYLGHFDGMS